MQQNVTQKLSWRLKELPAATGLTLAFWRKVVKLKRIQTRKIGGAVVILDQDLRDFLAGTPKKEGVNVETLQSDPTFAPNP